VLSQGLRFVLGGRGVHAGTIVAVCTVLEIRRSGSHVWRCLSQSGQSFIVVSASKRKEAPRAHMARALRAVAGHVSDREQFESNAVYREVIGGLLQRPEQCVGRPTDSQRCTMRSSPGFPNTKRRPSHFEVAIHGKDRAIRDDQGAFKAIAVHRSELEKIVGRMCSSRARWRVRAPNISGSFDEIAAGLTKLPKTSLSLLHRHCGGDYLRMYRSAHTRIVGNSHPMPKCTSRH